MVQLGADSLLVSDLIETSVDGVFLLDEDFQIFAWNQKMIAITGLSTDEAKGKTIFKISAQFKRDSFLEGLKRSLNNKGSVLRSKLIFNKIDHYETSISPFKLPFGEGIGSFVTLRKVEISRDDKFRPLVEESPIATAIYDKQGVPKYFNKSYGRIWGADQSISEKVLNSYNILEDEQLVSLGIMPFIEKAFAGKSAEIPPILYNPYDSRALRDTGLNSSKYVKGHLFPIKDKSGELEEVVIILNDITYQRQAEQILSEAHLKFERLTQGLPGVIYEYEEIGEAPNTFRYISEGCKEMFGVTPEETMLNTNLLEEKIHPDDIEDYRQSMQDSKFGAKNWEWTGRIVVENKVKWIEGKSSPAKLTDGSIVRYGLLLDITDKKKAEGRYQKAQERLQIALDGADLGLWEWDVERGKYLHNDSWAKSLGYTRDEFNKLFSDRYSLIHPDDLKNFQNETERPLEASDNISEVEYRMKRKDGQWVWILDRGKVLKRNKKGEVLKASGTLLDISKSKVTQSIIKQNEQLFTQLFENAPVGIVLLDEQHQVVQMNQGFEDLFGFSKDDVIGNQLNNIIVPKDYIQEAIDINTLTADGTVGFLESHRVNKSGELVPVIIYGVPVSLNQRTIGIYGIYVNISDRVKAEQELKTRNDELDNFVYKVSHDLRAPLSSILGLINLANHDDNEDDIHEYIGIIENRVQQLDSFINDVLSHSKNLKMEVKVDEIDFKKIIDDCFIELSYLPNSKNIIRRIAVNGGSFSSDVWRIREVFRNLISNAIKYSDSERDCSFVSIDVDIDMNEATITFEDNGIGIDTTSLPQIFEMFYRATTKAEGSGIGLYIVKNAIEKLGGNVIISSEPGVGSTFKINLPNHTKEAETKG